MAKSVAGELRVAFMYCLGVLVQAYIATDGMRIAGKGIPNSTGSSGPEIPFPFDLVVQDVIAFAFFYLMVDHLKAARDDEDYWWDDADMAPQGTDREFFDQLKTALHLADSFCSKYIENRRSDTFIQNRVIGYSELKRRGEDVIDRYRLNVLRAWVPSYDALEDGVTDTPKLIAIQIDLAANSLEALYKGTQDLYTLWKADPAKFASD